MILGCLVLNDFYFVLMVGSSEHRAHHEYGGVKQVSLVPMCAGMVTTFFGVQLTNKRLVSTKSLRRK